MSVAELMAAVYGGPGLWMVATGNNYGWLGLILGLFILWMHGETIQREATTKIARTRRKK